MLSMNNSLEKNEDETNNSNLSNEKKTDELSSSPSSFDKYRNIINIYPNNNTDEINFNKIDQLLEKEKQYNKTEQWTKLDKTIKIQKLHHYAEKYGKDNNLSIKDIKSLKLFFTDCLEKNKLNKTKDVQYDKEKRDISSIPALNFNHSTKNFTLKITDTKRVSTLKCLTPKKVN
jgi:hypothetical protein